MNILIITGLGLTGSSHPDRSDHFMWNVGTFLFDFYWLHSICRTGCVFRAGVSQFRVISTKCSWQEVCLGRIEMCLVTWSPPDSC